MTAHRHLLRNSRDPQFQGDGWRWTLSLWLPNILLWSSPWRNERWAGCPVRAPFTFDMLVLTRQQKIACFTEFHLTQRPVQGLAYLDWFPDEIPAKGYPEAAEEQPQPLARYPEF